MRSACDLVVAVQVAQSSNELASGSELVEMEEMLKVYDSMTV